MCSAHCLHGRAPTGLLTLQNIVCVHTRVCVPTRNSPTQQVTTSKSTSVTSESSDRNRGLSGVRMEVTCPRPHQRSSGSARSGQHTFAASQTREHSRGTPNHIFPEKWTKTPPSADRSLAFESLWQKTRRPCPRDPRDSEGLPSRNQRLTTGSAQEDLLLTWPCSVSLRDRKGRSPALSPNRVRSSRRTLRTATPRDPLNALRPQPCSSGSRPPLRDSPPWGTATPRQRS